MIQTRWIIPVEAPGMVPEKHAIAIQDDRIVATATADQISTDFQSENVTRLDDHALIPGLINAHTHAAISLMRGLADALPLMTWLNARIWPAERK